MSQSPTGERATDPSQNYLDSWSRLASKIQQGASFSGRERNCCFLNTRQTRFADVSSIFGLDQIDDGRAVAAVDWDHDGDLDLWQTNRSGPRLRFLRNDLQQNQQSFVSFQLIGDPSRKVNRDAIGARVNLTLKHTNGQRRRLVRTLYAGDGFLSQSSKVVHFGFDKDEAIDKVAVRWPGHAKEQSFGPIAPNQRYALSMKGGKAIVQAARRDVELQAGTVATSAPDAAFKLTISRPEKVSAVEYLAIDKQKRRVNFREANGHLIVLWANWCAPCLKELEQLNKGD